MNKIIVTGALGHIGSRMIRALPSLLPPCEIVMVDNLATQRYASLFDLPDGVPYRFIEADVTQTDMAPIIEGADTVIHLAALTDATASFDNREAVETINFAATENVAKACVKTGSAMIHASSTSVYGTQASQVDEDCAEDELSPQSPYAEIKLKEEALITDLVKNDGLRAVTFRFGTIYGTSPGMRFHTAVNKFCWQAVQGQSLSVWKTAFEQKRPYLDLTDAASAVAFFISGDLFDGRIYNVVTSNHTVAEVVENIRKHIPDVDISFVNERIMNQLSYEVLNTRLNAAGFSFTGNLGSGIGDTIRLLRNMNSAVGEKK